jgi:hypothetical protein
MRNLGVKEAADEIRDHLEASQLPPEDAHQLKFLQDIADELQLDRTPDNLHRIDAALHERDIALHAGHEYPKMVTRLWDGAQVIAGSPEDEETKINEPQPEPAKPPPARIAPREEPYSLDDDPPQRADESDRDYADRVTSYRRWNAEHPGERRVVVGAEQGTVATDNRAAHDVHAQFGQNAMTGAALDTTDGNVHYEGGEINPRTPVPDNKFAEDEPPPPAPAVLTPVGARKRPQ